MNDYQIIREVGKGGMGCVYEALDSQGNRVALKMMSAKAASHPDYREMFEHEVQALKKLSHPSIVNIVGEPFSDSAGNLYLPMEYVEGSTLAQIVKANGPFSEQVALDIFCKLLDVFSYIHGKSCIHRDVKPSNIMMRPDGSVCVIDFGIAKDSKISTGHTVGRIVGTDGYMSPEQANGFNIDTRTDIYSLGCLLHYMLTATHAIPKQSNDYETICAILENQFPLVSDTGITVSDRTQKAILAAVDKNMTVRYQNPAEFKAALSGKQRYKITVGRSNCDINICSEFVSGSHLDIIWEPQNQACTSFVVTIVDHSTNGTGVDGRKIKHDSYSFRTDKSVQSLVKDSSSLPQVMIAGLATQMLDWNAVLNILFSRLDLPTSVLPEPEYVTGPIVPVDHDKDEFGIGMYVLCFLIPIAGVILWANWKTDKPEKATRAIKTALWGFLFNIIISILSNL